VLNKVGCTEIQEIIESCNHKKCINYEEKVIPKKNVEDVQPNVSIGVDRLCAKEEKPPKVGF
jgi:hypothetical protein